MPLKKNKRHFLLLEVLIAFALIVLCAIPLIAPHVALLKSQRQFIQKIELDHMVNLIYADILEKLHRNDIGWGTIEHGTIFPIDETMLKRLSLSKPFPYEGYYQIQMVRHKPPRPAAYTLYLLKLSIQFLPLNIARNGTAKEKENQLLKYEYDIFVERNLEGDTSMQPQDAPQAPPQAAPLKKSGKQ